MTEVTVTYLLIKFLESLPAIEVFAGADDMFISNEFSSPVSQSMLAEWIREHDKIERETEVFDSGDLQKLKRFTKGTLVNNL